MTGETDVRHDLTGVVATQVQSFSDTELAQFMMTMMLIGELHPTGNPHTKSPLLDELPPTITLTSARSGSR